MCDFEEGDANSFASRKMVQDTLSPTLSPSNLFLYEILAVDFVLCTLRCCQLNEKEMKCFPSLLVLTLFLFGFALLDFCFFFLYRCWYNFIAVGANIVCGLGVLFCFVFFEEKIASWDFNLFQFTYQLFSCFYKSSHDLHVLLFAVFFFCNCQGNVFHWTECCIYYLLCRFSQQHSTCIKV